MATATVAVTPVAVPALGDVVAGGDRVLVLLVGIGVGLSSSVVPRPRGCRGRLRALVALLPATGAVVLAQVPTPRESVGLAVIGLGVAWHRPAAAGSAGPPVERLHDAVAVRH